MKTYIYSGRLRDGMPFQGEVTARHFAEAVVYANGEIERLDSQAKLLTLQELSDDDAIVRLSASLARIMEQSQRITDAFNSGDSDLPDIDPGSNAQLSRFLAAVRAANDEIHREVAQHLSD